MYTCIIFLINYFQMITVFQEQPVFHKMRGICVVVQSLNCVRLFVSLWTAAHQAPWPLLSPRVCSDSCPLSRLMSTESVMLSNHLISSSVAPFFLLQSFPASGSFPVSQFLALGGQSIGVSASASILPMNIQTDFL